MKKLLTTIAAAIGIAVGSATALADSINLSTVTADTNVVDGTTLTGTLGANVQITIADGATVTLDGVAINGVTDEDYSWAGITCEGGATIILKGENTVKGFHENYPGIYVPEGSTLTIQGDGSLNASSNGCGAGIGGGSGIACGNIVIEGGTIVATGGECAAGIGGGFEGSCGNIEVNGGAITATGGDYAPGIGGGAAASCGDIVIAGGAITATGGECAPGIGGGDQGSCGDITIADTVTRLAAIKGDLAPYSIGKGFSVNSKCGTVTICGTVYANGITQSPYIYPSYTATLKDGTEDADNWTITPNEGVAESNTVTVAYAGENKVKSVKAKKGTEEITVTPVEGKTNEWTFAMPAADVVVEVEYFAVATFDVDGETYAVTTNVVGEAVATPEEDPVKIGHTFAGWFTAATGGTQITDETLMGIADTTFYAQFRAPILTIENGVLTAVDFNGCTNLALTIPDTVTTIGDSAFYQCTGLTSVTIPGSVKTISHAAFRDCSNLTSVTIEEGVTTIGERAFARCVNLASITIPGTVTAISEAAFSDCKSLTSLTIPGSVKTIGPQAFQNCTGLESVTIEEGVETIDRVAFDGCENLASVTIPDSVTSIGKDAFAGCSDALYEAGTGNLAGVKLVDGWAVGYDAGSISENLDLTGVRGIAGGAFAGCDVITSVIIPDGVATIPEYVFNGCDNLTGVTIPDSVTSIEEGAFGGCDNLASVTIPDSVTSIGKDAFEGCNEELFDTTTLTGVALVDGWAVGYTDALPENLDLAGARGIADNAFRDSTLESVTIPGTVARVPAGAFMSCSSLASVTLEEGVTAIDDSAFIECSALESLEIPDTVTEIGPQAFVSCAKLASVTVPGSVAEIGPAAFGMCSSLTNITIEAGVTNIGMMAFAMCSALESLELPGTVTAIGAQAFLMSMNLASVTIPASVKEIGQDAFLYTALSTVYVEYGDGDRVKALLAASGFDTDNLEFVETSSPLPVYRFYSQNYKGHFFTIDEEEKEYIIANNRNWSFEGTAYRAFTNQVPGTAALHRFYSKNYRGHFFTIDEEEAEVVKRNHNWEYEGVAYYVYPQEVEDSVPAFRFWSNSYRHHFYTTDAEEKDVLIATNPNWAYEGVAFYALEKTDESGLKSLKKSVLSAAVGSRGVLALSAADGGATGAGLGATLGGGDAAGSGLRATLGGGRGATSLPDETSSLTEWTLSAEDGTAIAEPGTTEVGEILVETLQDVPDYAEFEEDASRAERQTVSLHLVLPAGVWRAKLWNAVDGEGDEESAEGALDFDLPATGVWHWLRVAPEDAENPDSPAYSLWIRATAD